MAIIVLLLVLFEPNEQHESKADDKAAPLVLPHPFDCNFKWTPESEHQVDTQAQVETQRHELEELSKNFV